MTHLPVRERRLLNGIGKSVSQSDPHLAAMLAIFGRISAAEPMPGHERLRTPASQAMAMSCAQVRQIARGPAHWKWPLSRRIWKRARITAARRELSFGNLFLENVFRVAGSGS
jgi:hypothetical protein